MANIKKEDPPKGYEYSDCNHERKMKLMQVLNGERTGWWRYHDHYDRDGYCDNPNRGY